MKHYAAVLIVFATLCEARIQHAVFLLSVQCCDSRFICLRFMTRHIDLLRSLWRPDMESTVPDFPIGSLRGRAVLIRLRLNAEIREAENA